MLDLATQNSVHPDLPTDGKIIPGMFSVVVPVFNARRDLKSCLDCVLAAMAQYGNAELIVVDNGSTDGSYEILRTVYGSAKIRQITGVTIATLRNSGARMAQGEYLSFLDSDCVVGEDYFHEALSVFTSLAADATGSMCVLPDRTNWIERNWHALHARQRDGYVNYLNSGNLVIRRAAFFQVGGFDQNLVTGEDADLADRLRKAGFKIYECHAVRAVHLGIPRSLRQFIRRQAWYGQGMTGNLRLWKPLVMPVLYLASILLALASLFVVPSSLVVVRAVVFLLFVNTIPLLAICYRLAAVSRIAFPLTTIFLYHCFCCGRLFGLVRALTGDIAGTYRKDS